MSQETFSETEYNSNDGMLTSVWGPSTWHLMHTMSFNYPVKPTQRDKEHYRKFILNLENTLPCGKCRENLKKNFARLPLRMRDMKSRATFSKYVYDLHEVVNDMLGKVSGLTYDMVRQRYENFRARCSTKMRDQKRKKKCPKNTAKHRTKAKKENGCTEPIFEGTKAKCVLKIIPHDEKCETFQIDEKCVKKRLESSP